MEGIVANLSSAKSLLGDRFSELDAALDASHRLAAYPNLILFVAAHMHPPSSA